MAEQPQLPDNLTEQIGPAGKLNDGAALNIIREILGISPRTNFHLALGRIMERLREENGVLLQEGRPSVPQMALAVRNIMELRIWLRYACQSEANTERFINDLATNAASTLRSLLRMVNNLADSVKQPMRATPEQYKMAGRMQDSRAELGLANEGPLMARTLARVTGLEKEYLAISSLTSPLIHPSAISVLGTFDIDCYREPLQAFGLMSGAELIVEAREHIEIHGFKPAVQA